MVMSGGHSMKLVINTNSNTCHIYHYDKHPAQLTLVKEINHPENKLKNSDMDSDRSGHYQGGQSSRGAYSPHTETKDIHIDNFAREIAKEMNQERIKKDYDELIIIAPPRMCGLLFQHIDKHVKDLIINKIEKDILYLSDNELLDFLRTHTQYHDQP
jgi:protein required for attachment to host cells